MQAASQQCVQALMQDMSLTTQPSAPARMVPTPDPVKAPPPANTASPHARRGILSTVAPSARTELCDLLRSDRIVAATTSISRFPSRIYR